MNQLVKNRTLNIIVIILLVANIASFGFFWLRQTGQLKNEPMAQRGEAVEFLVRELKMTDAQRNELKRLRSEHRETIAPLKKQQEELKDSFFALVKNDSVPQSDINDLLSRMGSIDKEIDLVTLNHFKAIRKICTIEQQPKFDEIIQQAIRMMPTGPKGPPRNGDRPPPRGEEGPTPNGEDGPPPPPQD